MGPFLVEPLLEELQTAAESPAPLHDARRLLEASAVGRDVCGCVVRVIGSPVLHLHQNVARLCGSSYVVDSAVHAKLPTAARSAPPPAV